MASQLQEHSAITDVSESPLLTSGEVAFSERIQQEPELAVLLLNEFVSLLINGESDVARVLLRDLVNATVGFEELAKKTGTPSKSLHRMLSAKGNPTMDNLAAIINVLRQQLQIETLEIRATMADSGELTGQIDGRKSA